MMDKKTEEKLKLNVNRAASYLAIALRRLADGYDYKSYSWYQAESLSGPVVIMAFATLPGTTLAELKENPSLSHNTEGK